MWVSVVSRRLLCVKQLWFKIVSHLAALLPDLNPGGTWDSPAVGVKMMSFAN